MVIERLAYKPLRSAPSLAVLITAIGVSYFLQNSALLIWKSDPKVFTSVVDLPSITLFGDKLTISSVTVVTVLANIVIMLALTTFTGKTKMGKSMRAVSEDKDAAQLMGIDVNRTISMTFAIGSGLAAIAGVLLCSAYPTLMPTTGSMPGIKAFTAAVLGGIGSIPGAMLGGILLGIIEIFAKAYISTQLSDAIVFAVLIIVLLIRPTGLLGKQIREKV
jgi:branched-chain amino acid transport system permease protein